MDHDHGIIIFLSCGSGWCGSEECFYFWKFSHKYCKEQDSLPYACSRYASSNSPEKITDRDEHLRKINYLTLVEASLLHIRQMNPPSSRGAIKEALSSKYGIYSTDVWVLFTIFPFTLHWVVSRQRYNILRKTRGQSSRGSVCDVSS